MAKLPKCRRLADAYTFPGFRPLARVQGLFGDPKARLITLVRRRKKRSAARVAPGTTPGTTAADVGRPRHVEAAGALGPPATADVLAQLGNRVQHALRAFTPDDAKALKAAVRTYPNTAYDLEELLTQLGTGEAVVTDTASDAAASGRSPRLRLSLACFFSG